MLEKRHFLSVFAVFFLSLLAIPVPGLAHCDTLDGPVVMAAKQALEKGDVTPVLKWVKKEQEGEIREAFQKTMAVRTKGPEVKELADMYFFETLVRIHRASEGAPYTGLTKGPAEPIIAAVDKALEKGSVDHVVKHVTTEVAKGIRERFSKTAELRKHSEDSVSTGREYVEAYVELTHYVERLFNDAIGHSGAHGKPDEAGHRH